MPEASAFELRNIWGDLERVGKLSFSNLREATEDTLDRRILGAITRRLDRMEQTGLFTDNPVEATELEREFEKIKGGGAIIKP